MNKPFKQHLIDPEICIRCYTCEMTCPVGAIQHDDNNVVVDADACNFCMDCIPVCPTGSIDEWRVVTQPYSVDEQFGWDELPAQAEITQSEADGGLEAIDDAIAALLADAHAGAGGRAVAPQSAAKPAVNTDNLGNPIEATVQGNYRLTENSADIDIRHIILNFDGKPFKVLEGQRIGIIPPGQGPDGKPHLPRLYSVSSPRDGERPNYGNLSLTVKREEGGLCSNYVCDLKPGDKLQVTGPFGATFLLPEDPQARLLMICTGTGSAPMRAFTMRRQRENSGIDGKLSLYFGARTPEHLPYFGPLKKVPENFLKKHFAFSRQDGQPKAYVQDKIRENATEVAQLLQDPKGYSYMGGKKEMEAGVEQALSDVARGIGLEWTTIRDAMREDGRYHVETY